MSCEMVNQADVAVGFDLRSLLNPQPQEAGKREVDVDKDCNPVALSLCTHSSATLDLL